AGAARDGLRQPLRDKELETPRLAAVQQRRDGPPRATQQLQVIVQNRVIRPALSAEAPLRPPLLLRLAASIPMLRGLTARLVGLGLRPEHIGSPELPPAL